MTTVNQQKEMFYNASRQAVIKQMGGYLEERRKQRYQMVKQWHENGRLEADWEKVVEFDNTTDKQEAIYDDLIVNAK